MSLMLSNRPSPRPGFTHVAEAHSRDQGPVVVVVSESPDSVAALRRAAEEASLRSARLSVVDTCSADSFREHLEGRPEGVDERESSVALSILANSNVSMSAADGDFGDIATYCQEIGARLLVLGRGSLGASAPTIGRRLNQSDLTCDILVVHEMSGVAQ